VNVAPFDVAQGDPSGSRGSAGANLVAAAVLAVTVLAQSDAVIRITAGRADIRSDASPAAPILRQVTEGTYLILIKEDGDWFQIQVPTGGLRAIGYVRMTDARKVTGAEAAAATEAVRHPPAKPPGDTIAIGAELPGKTIWLKAQATRPVPVAGIAPTIAAAASSEALKQILGVATEVSDIPAVVMPPGVNDVVWIWVARANASAPVLASRRPSFYVSYGEVPGLNSNEWAPYVVRLEKVSEGWRVLSVLAGPALARNYSQRLWALRKELVQNEMAASLTGLTHGMVRLTLSAPLEPGAYAVVIRPAFPQRWYSGREVFSEDGPGVAFGAAWVFGIK